MKLFTVIVTFNRPHFLRKCINSIISQTIKPSKIYIVNNNKLKNDNKKIYEEYKNKINIEYLDNRRIDNFNKINYFKKSKLFIAYYINQIRLIDNL